MYHKTYLLLLLFCLFITAKISAQQKIEVLVVGTAHNYKLDINNDFEISTNAVKTFNPDIICTEYLSLDNETKQVIEQYYGERFIKRRDFLKSKSIISEQNAPKIIKKNVAVLQESNNYHQTRMDLALAYFLNYDLGNAHFQVYQLMTANLGSEELVHLQKTLDIKDSLFRYTARKNSEYAMMVFPLAIELKKQKLYGIDCQRYETPWNVAWETSDSLLKQFENRLYADSNQVDNRKAIDVLNKFYSDYQASQKLYGTAQKTGTLNQFANSKAYDELGYWGDFLRDDVRALKGFPTEIFAEKHKYWQLRNEEMVANILKTAKQTKAKRLVVFVGASHRKILHDLLEKAPNVTVKYLSND